MNQSTTFAQVATNLLNVLQGYTKGIRFVAVLTMLLIVGIGQAWAETKTYSYTFSAKQFSANGSKTLNTVSWTLAGNGNYWGYDGTKGQQFGSGSAPYTTLTLSTSGISGTITKIIINTSGASSVNASFTVSVGGTQWGSSTKLTTEATAYTFTGSNSGEIKFSYTQTSSKALYIKSISVTYETAASCTVTYNANGGSGTMTQSTGSSITLKECTFTAPSGKEFDEWNTAANGSGTSYQAGNIVNKSLNLYAIWKELPKYTVTWDVNGDPSVKTQVAEGSKPTFPAPPASCDDESDTFYGWSTATWDGKIDDINGKEIYTSANDMPAVNGAVTYYAVFATKGTGGGTAFDGTSGGDFKIYALVGEEKKYLKGTGTKISPVGESEATEYTFTKISDGVFSIKTGTTYLIYASSTDLGTSNSAYSWTISKGTKGSWRIASTNTTTRGIVYRAGTTNQFGGYALSNITLNGTEYYDVEIGGGSSVSYSGYITTCATKTSVTLNPNGGKFTSTPDGWTKEGNKLTKEVDGSVTLPTPIHDGCYDFAGWYDAQTGGNEIDADAYTPTGDIELFAHWTESTTSFIAMIDDENIPTVEGFAIEIGLNKDGTGKDTDGVETTCGNNVYLFRTLVQGYKEVQWTVTIDGTQETIAVQNDGEVPHFVMPKADVFVSAELIECDEMDAPDVTATSTNNSITLSWDPITGAKEYNVFIFYDYGNSHQKDNAYLVENETSYTFTNLDAEHTYTYIVQAQTEIGTCFTETMGEIATASATCTVTYDANGGKGTITDATEYTNGAKVTVKGNFGNFTKDGYAFTGWNTKADGSGYSYNHNDQFDITANTTLYAQWCEAYWKLVTDESELENDTRIVIAAKDYNFALSTTQNTNNRGQAEIIKKYNTITFGVNVQSLGLVGLANNEFALYDAVNNGYLYAASSTANQLKTGGNSNKNGNWDFSISKDGTAYILAQGSNTNNQLKYNAGSDLFSCYGEDNSQKDVVIYKEVRVQDQYNVTSTLTNAIAANNNPTTVSATATSLTLNYSANTSYLLPKTITVKMGGALLVATTDYTWDKATGTLTINVSGFYGDIDVKIVAEEDPCYGFAMSEVTATSTTNSITLTWTEITGATGYNVRLGDGAFTATTELTHTFTGLNPKTTYTWEVQAIKGTCQASQTGSTTTQKETFTVKWVVNGDAENPVLTEDVVDGNSITQYPSVPSAPSGCHEKVPVGWTNTPINTPTNETPATLYKQKSDVPAITDNTILHAVWADEKRVEGQPLEVEETASVNISSYASANSWENDTKYESVIINSKITASASSNGTNTGKYFTNGNNWRFYQSDKGQLTITAADGCTIKTVKITYTVDKTGVLTYSGSNKESNSEITVNASSATFGVGNTESATNGQVRITDISVTYTTTTKGEEIITYSAYTTLCDNCTPSEDLVLEASANTADLDITGKATITFSTTGGNGGAITYTANPKTGVNWENGVATFTKADTYQITASQEKNGEYCPTTSNTVNVTITAIPHLYFVTDPAPTTIEFDPVECGGNTRVEDKKSVSVQAYNLAAAVTAQVTGPYKIARTSSATLNDYDTKLTLDNNQDGHINGNYDDVYILSFPPAGSSEPTEGTLTFTTTNGNELTVSLSTPTITCTPCTLTFNDRGIKTTQEYYAGTEVPEPTTPTGVCGEYEFDGWALAKVESGSTTYAKVEFPYIMPANNQTVLHAVYRYTEVGIPEDKFMSVDANIGELESGKDYVLTGYYDSEEHNGDDEEYALSITAYENGKYTTKVVDVNVSSTLYEEGIPYYELNTTDNEIIWTITGDDTNGYIFQNKSNSQYLNVSNNNLGLSDTPTAFTVVHETGVKEGVDIYYMSLLIQPKGSSYYLSSYNKEDVGVLFNIFRSNTLSLFLYKRATTPLYTTTPDCHPTVTLTSDGEVYVTATNGRGIMAATPLTLSTTDLAPNTEIAISSNSNDIYFSTERNTNFAMAQASQPKTSLTLTTNAGGELETPLYIHYKPSADGDGTPAEVVVTADVSTHNPPFTAQQTIHVRNLPAKFVIATKAGATWYALPANMSGATNPAAVVIEVDETTMTATAPNTIPYTLFPVKTTNGSGDRYTQYGDRVRFSAINYEYRGLWANNNATEQTIRNFAVIDAIGDDGEAAYEWKVATTVVDGNWQYTLYSDQGNNKNHLCYSMNQENPAWGTYASNEAQYQLYFLPIKAETTPFDYQVVEWYPNKLLIHTTTAFSSLTAKIAGEQVANVQYTAKDANQYEVTGLPLMKNPAKALTLEFVVADATHTGIHTIPVMLSGGDHSVSTLAIGKGIYNYTNLVVRDGATLTVDGAANTDNTFYDVTIYPTAKISVPEGKQLSVHRMTFIGGITEVYDGANYTLNKYGVPELSLKGKLGKTVPTMDYIMRVNLDQMYQVGVPYDVNLGEITYWDGSAIELGDELYVSAYDGQARANREKKTWIYETDFETKLGAATLKAGVGYTISAEPQNSDDTYSILRMPMKSNISSGSTEGNKTINVVAYDNQKGVTITDNHKGWNYLSNPYMTTISGGEADTKLVLGSLKETGTGPWEWVNDEIRYVTIPHDNGQDYYQMQFSNAVLKPFKSFFLQIAENGDLSFALASRQNAPARLLQQQTTSSEVEFELLLSNGKQSDNTGLLISEEYTPAYEINADLEKMTGSMSLYTIYNGYKLAYNATSLNEAKEWIPLGYIVPTTGEYTFELDEQAAVEDIVHIYLIDYETGAITDLLDNTYTFDTSVKKSESRFAINVVLRSDAPGTATGIDNTRWSSDQPQKFIYNGMMYILHNGTIYDANGQQVKTINK